MLRARRNRRVDGLVSPRQRRDGPGGGESPPHRELVAVGAYVFAGGFTVGVSEHFKVAATCEGDGAYGVATHRLNFPHVPAFHGPARWPDGLRAVGPVDFIYANPPCAAWSVAGVSLTKGPDAWKTDPRTECWRQSFQLFEDAVKRGHKRPHVLAIESVTQAYMPHRGRPLMNELAARALALGYSVTHLLVDAKWLGAPQCRRRYFFVAHDVAFKPGAGNWAPAASVQDTLALVHDPGVVQPHNPGHARWLKRAKPGEGLKHQWHLHHGQDPAKWPRRPDGRVPGRPMFFEGRLPLDRPAGTFVGDFWYHPTEDRKLGHNEHKALCGFPQSFEVAGDNRHWASLLARGVLPPVAEWLARHARAAIEAGAPESGNVYEVDLRKPPLNGVEPNYG